MRRALSIVFALVLVTSAVAPVALAGSATAAPPGFVTTGSDVVETEVSPENGPPQHALAKGQGNGPGQAGQGNGPGQAGQGNGPPMHALEQMPAHARENVMASRGSIQTQWAVRSNGQPVIVATDETNSEDGEIAVPVEAFESSIGEVPELAYGYHESGEQWESQIRVEDGYAIITVPHFSTNTITWSGMFTIDSQSIDGSQYTYTQESTDTISQYTINITGQTATEWDNESAGSATNGDTMSLSIGGNADPTGPSANGEPQVVLTGTQSTGDRFTPSGTGDGSITVNGDAAPSGPNSGEPEITFEGDDSATQNNQTGSNIGAGNSDSVTVDGNIEPTDGSGGEPELTVTAHSSSSSSYSVHSGGTKVEDEPGGSFTASSNEQIVGVTFSVSFMDADGSSGDVRAYVDGSKAAGEYRDSWNEGSTYTIWFNGKHIKEGESHTVSVRDWTGTNSMYVDSVSAEVERVPTNLTVYDDQSASSNIGAMSDGESKTVPIDINSDTTQLNFDSSVGQFDYTLAKVDRSAVENPSVDVTGDGAADASHTGVLKTGQNATVQLADLQDGDSTVDIAVGSGPSPGWTITYDEELYSHDPSFDLNDDGSQEVGYTGTLSPGQTHTQELSSLSTSDSTASIGTSDGKVDAEIQLKERTKTTDPSVEVNGNTVSHTGTLNDGETVSLSPNTSWVQDGENQVNVSVAPSATADWPTPKAQLFYQHEGTDDSLVSYTGEKFSERYNVSKTFGEDQQEAEINLSFAGPVVSFRTAEKRVNGGSWTTIPDDDLSVNSGNATISIGQVAAGDTVDVRFVGSKVNVHNGQVRVAEPTPADQELNSEISVENTSGDLKIGVGGLPDGDRIHYTTSESWSNPNTHAYIESGGKQQIVASGAGSGETFTMQTAPLSASPQTGEVVVEVKSPDSSEPSLTVEPGDNTGDEVEYTFYEAADGESYVLYSQTNEIVRDSGTANSPITLNDDDSAETLVFMIDDGGTTSSGGDSGGGPVPVERSDGIDFGGIGILAVVLVGGLGLLFVVSRRGSGTVSRVAGGVISGIQGTTRWLTSNPRITALLGAVGFVAAVGSGFIQLPSGTGILLLVSGVPLATFLILRRVNQFSPLAFGTISIIVVVIGLQLLGADPLNILLSNLGPALPIIAIGLLYILYQRVKASRAPDEVNEVTIEADGGSERGRR